MRKSLLLSIALLAFAGSARAQFCPGANGWVFDDVLPSDPFCGYITYMATSGVTQGCAVIDANHRLFCPNNDTTRKEVSAFLSRLAMGAVFAQGGNAFGMTAVLGTDDDYPVEIRVKAERVAKYQPTFGSPNIIAGHFTNNVDSFDSGQTIAGGGLGGNDCYDIHTGTPTRPCPNQTRSRYSAVSGGVSNQANGWGATVAGGASNTVSNDVSTIGGGYGHTANGYVSTIAGGYGNTAAGGASVVSGGQFNSAAASFSMVPGGSHNTASGSFSFAAGNRAKATTTGSFVWADSKDFDFAPTVANLFGARATGGVNFTVAIDPSTGAPTQACEFLPGTSGWSCTSDRNAKENLVVVQGDTVLARVVAMPVYVYNFKGANPALRMLGPTAQDFHRAFELGDSDKTIASGNIQGVALAAIQGLNAKLEREIADRDVRIEQQAREIADLKRAVEVLMAKMAYEGKVAVQ